MKKLLIIFFSILSTVALPAMAADANSTNNTSATITVSGTVLNENDKGLPYAEVIVFGTTNGVTSGPDGKFTLKNVPSNAKLEISYVGYKKQTINASANPTIKMVEDAQPIKDINVPGCTPSKYNATKSEFSKTQEKCIPTECADGYTLVSDNNTPYTIPESCKNDINDDTCTISPNIKCVKTETKIEPETNDNDNTPRLTKEQSQAKIDELKDNAQKMKDKEQSTANKLLGAAGIGATGIGGMQMASAMAEQNADADAERDMRAYLATFHCNYGGGKNIKYGETDVELPGGNELIGLYSEYVNLANDLKVRKTALDMRPGIESEPILDSATSGLYDDVAVGKTSGAYASLARALLDPNGADAAAWAKQKEDTASKKKTGMITAGIGAAGSLIGNLAINSGDDKQNKVDDILNKYDKLRKPFEELENNISKLPPSSGESCPANSTGTWPECICTSSKYIHNDDNNSCDECPGDLENVSGKCQCPQGKRIKGNDQCIDAEPSDQCKGPHMVHQQGTKNQCTCIDGYTLSTDGTKCECNAPRYESEGQCICGPGYTPVEGTNSCTCASPKQEIGGKCKIPETPATQVTTTINLPTDSLFEIGKADITTAAQTALNGFIENLKNNGVTDLTIEIKGYTDGTGSDKLNQTLSQKRADAVLNYLRNNSSGIFASNSTAIGMGEGECNCGAGTIPSGKETDIDYKQCVDKNSNYTHNYNLRFAPCRKVTISTNDSSKLTVVKNAVNAVTDVLKAQ